MMTLRLRNRGRLNIGDVVAREEMIVASMAVGIMLKDDIDVTT